MIDLETHVVASRYDPLTERCHYTVEQNGKRWTFDVALSDLNACGRHDSTMAGPGPNDQKRRQLIHNAAVMAMRGPPDAMESTGEPVQDQ